uniref:SNARE associated Golgi protein n=1 Tax=Caulobacter sp. (strain K31) TaxID=366602 RepID=B0T9F3_CAUSK
MDALLAGLSTFVSDHHAWAGVTLGLATFLESLVLIGAFIPATALMLVAGGLIATGALDAVSVLLWSSAGAVLGDAVSYALGARLGGSVLRGRLFVRHRRTIARTRLFARRYGVGSIFLGRFFGPLRAFVPVMAGMVRMKAHTFQIANVASALIWVAVLVAPGYLAAQGLSVLSTLPTDQLAPIGLAAVSLAAVGLAACAAVFVTRRKPALVLAVRHGPTTAAAAQAGQAHHGAIPLDCCAA